MTMLRYFEGYIFPDELQAVRLIEYLEVIIALGAEKIVIYEFDFHPTISKIFDHYKHILEVIPISYAGHLPNVAGLYHHYTKEKLYHHDLCKHENLHYSDCFYRNMYR